MKINFGATFQLKGIGTDDVIYMESEQVTLRDFLIDIMQRGDNSIKFFDPDGCVNQQKYIVSVNGRELDGYSDELDINLKDEDYIYITFPMLGGG